MNSNIQALLNSQSGQQTLVMMTGEQLQKLIDDVRNDTRRIVEEQFQPSYYTAEELMELLDVSRSTINKWMSSGKICGYKMDDSQQGKLYFDKAEIRDAMKKGRLGKHVRSNI